MGLTNWNPDSVKIRRFSGVAGQLASYTDRNDTQVLQMMIARLLLSGWSSIWQKSI
jgi:hypothetical protein